MPKRTPISDDEYMQCVKLCLVAARDGKMDILKKNIGTEDEWKSKEYVNDHNYRENCFLNPNIRDVRWRTLLMYAAGFSRYQVCMYLLSHPYIVLNLKDDCDKTVLHHAARRSSTSRDEKKHCSSQSELVYDLAAARATFDLQDHKGLTPLAIAVEVQDRAVCKMLLYIGANKTIKDYEGHNLMDIADLHNDVKMGVLLKHNDCPAAAKSKFNEDVANYIKENGEDPSNTTDGGSSADEHYDAKALANRKKGKLPAKPIRINKATGQPVSIADAVDGGASGDAAKKSMASAKKKPKAKAKSGAKSKGGSDDAAAADGAATTERPRCSTEDGEKPEDTFKKKSKQDKKDAEEIKADQVSPDTGEKDGILKGLNEALASEDIHELEAAINRAKNGGFDMSKEESFKNAKKLLTDLQARTAALKKACDSYDEYHSKEEDVDHLSDNIAKLDKEVENASKAGCKEKDLESLRSSVEKGKKRLESRKKLLDVCNGGDVNKIKDALKAEEGNLIACDVEEFEKTIEMLGKKDEAKKGLEEAMADKSYGVYPSVDKLKTAIGLCKSCGVDTTAAQKVLDDISAKKDKLDALSTEFHVANDKISPDNIISKFEDCKKAGIKLTDHPLMEEVSQWVEDEKKRQAILAKLKELMETTKNFAKEDDDGIEKLTEQKQAMSEQLKLAREVKVPEPTLNDFETRRKRIHNKIQDLKGSIRVITRVRPFNQREKDAGDYEAVTRVDDITLKVDEGNGKTTNYTFDSAFFPGKQTQVFEDTKDLIQSVFDGYNVAIFAYGQTGAGKTYTMTGKPDDPGVVPRSCAEIFRIIKEDEDKFNFTVKMHMIELYCAGFTDLLAKGVGQKGVKPPEINVRREKDGTISIDGALDIQVDSAADMDAKIQQGFDARSVAATAMNSESSRSHTITIAKVTTVNKETKATVHGKLIMCDLAGCERIAKSEVTGQAQKEAIEINKSLTALGDVIEALTTLKDPKNLSTVPYRNHKLTQLLQDALGGSSKTLMFMNCSPASSNLDETSNALKYAQRAKKVVQQKKKK